LALIQPFLPYPAKPGDKNWLLCQRLLAIYQLIE
jgi:hypothetical protein